jgi:hypothetical protein
MKPYVDFNKAKQIFVEESPEIEFPTTCEGLKYAGAPQRGAFARLSMDGVHWEFNVQVMRAYFATPIIEYIPVKAIADKLEIDRAQVYYFCRASGIRLRAIRGRLYAHESDLKTIKTYAERVREKRRRRVAKKKQR